MPTWLHGLISARCMNYMYGDLNDCSCLFLTSLNIVVDISKVYGLTNIIQDPGYTLNYHAMCKMELKTIKNHIKPKTFKVKKPSNVLKATSSLARF
jgi:hypothetical protein